MEIKKVDNGEHNLLYNLGPVNENTNKLTSHRKPNSRYYFSCNIDLTIL
jgi:hypothetical protein